MRLYKYWAYGIKVASVIEFPELYPLIDDELFDLTIEQCDIKFLKDKIDHPAPYAFKKINDRFLIHIRSVAYFEISNGSNITIYPYQDALNADIRVYCLSNAFAAALHQRKMLPLHAGAVIKEDKLTFITGNTGAGKSTLLFHLMQRGWRIFSDDVVVLSTIDESKEIHASPSYPMMKLWKHQMNMMGLDNQQQVRTGVDKFPFLFHDDFEIQSRTVDSIIILKVTPDATACNIRQLKGVESMSLLFKMIYRNEYLNKVENLAYLPQISALVTKIPCYEITRPDASSTENEVVHLFTSI